MNTAILIGRLTAEPELKTTGTGKRVTSFTLAVDRRFKSAAERKTDFINCTAWDGQAEFVMRYFAKGDPIGIEGRIQVEPYEDKTGIKRTSYEIVAEQLFFAGNTKKRAENPPTFEEITPFDDGDLPFK